MAYTISKSNGATLITLNDGLVDSQVTSINLIGKNVSNFGDAQNENFVKLLEHFSSSVQPRRPLEGQIWFNTLDQMFRPAVFDGTRWRPFAVLNYSTTATDININSGGFAYAASRPGDLWFDSANKQLHVVTAGSTTATETVVIGPEQVTGFDTTRMASARVLDRLNVARPIIKITCDGEVIGVISKDTFDLAASTPIPGFAKLGRGLTFKNYSSSSLYTTATTDVQLYGLHEQLDPTFVRRNISEHIQSSWFVDNGYSLQFGTTAQANITWDTGASDLKLQTSGKHRLQTPTTSLYFDGVQLYPSANTVNLGSTVNRFNSIYVSEVQAGQINATTASIFTVTATQLNASKIRTTNADFDAAQVNTNFTATNIFGSTINVTSATFGQTLTSDGVFGTVSTVDATISDSMTATNYVGANTFTGFTYLATEIFTDRINVASTLTCGNLLVNGNSVVTSNQLNPENVTAQRLKGDGTTGNLQASVSSVGNTIAQRGGSGELNATSVVVSNISAAAVSATITGNWTLTSGSTLQASYADLAEKYLADTDYDSGTVLEFGGTAEVQVAEDGTRRIAGIVSTNPAHILNAELQGQHVVTLALLGRVPCKVRGQVRKGDMMVAAGDGYARAEYSPILGSVIGKALEDFNGVSGVIEVVVGRL
jgi:hypothetical protein